MTRNLFYSTLSAASALFMLALLGLAGTTLQPEGYGMFSFAIALGTIAEAFMDFGLHQVTVRGIARDRGSAGRLFYNSLVLKVLPGLAMVLVFGVLAFVLRSEATVRTASLLMLAAAAMRSYLLTARGIFLGLELFGHDAIVTAGDRLLLLIACGTALVNGAGVVEVSVVFLVVRVATAGGALVLARRHVGGMTGTLDTALWRALPVEALPIGAFLLVLSLYNYVDTLMLGSLASDVDTGLYTAAYRLYEGLIYPTAVISAVLVPRLSRLWVENRAEYRALALKGSGGALGLAVLTAAVAWPLSGFGLNLVFDASYLPAITPLRILLTGLPFVYLIWVLHGIAMSAFRTGLLLRVTAIGTVLNVVLNLALIPGYTYNGSAVATVVSEGIVMLLLGYGLRDVMASEPAPPRRAPA